MKKIISCGPTCVTILSKDVQEDICISSTSFHVGSEHTHYVFIYCKIGDQEYSDLYKHCTRKANSVVNADNQNLSEPIFCLDELRNQLDFLIVIRQVPC